MSMMSGTMWPMLFNPLALRVLPAYGPPVLTLPSPDPELPRHGAPGGGAPLHPVLSVLPPVLARSGRTAVQAVAFPLTRLPGRATIQDTQKPSPGHSDPKPPMSGTVPRQD